jgi:assimilatory nitrate reductase catalytic subunit
MEDRSRRWEKTYCPYCAVGCGLEVDLTGGKPVKVRGDARHPANFGEICAKAAHLVPTIQPPGRAQYPPLRKHRGEPLKRTTWGDALGYAARRFVEIIERHGPDAVAVYGSGQRRAPNNLTNRAIDPVSKQPELKFVAINLRALSRVAGVIP